MADTGPGVSFSLHHAKTLTRPDAWIDAGFYAKDVYTESTRFSCNYAKW